MLSQRGVVPISYWRGHKRGFYSENSLSYTHDSHTFLYVYLNFKSWNLFAQEKVERAPDWWLSRRGPRPGQTQVLNGQEMPRPSFLAYLQPISMSIPDPQDRHITKYEGCRSCSKGEKSCKTIKHWTPCSTPTGPWENGSIGIKHTWLKKSKVRVCWIKGSFINQWASVGTRNAEREEGAGVCIRKACGNDKAKEIHRSWRARVER